MNIGLGQTYISAVGVGRHNWHSWNIEQCFGVFAYINQGGEFPANILRPDAIEVPDRTVYKRPR